jgi:hypothetical protein
VKKTVSFQLNKFPTTPNALRIVPSVDKPAESFEVDLCRLYHHYYTDSWGTRPPNPDHANFEYLRFLSDCSDFRFLGNGAATSSGKKRTMSTDLGQAFCRYFLYEYCGLTYFAHMSNVLNKETHVAFNGLKVKRITDGDVPDYLCARSVSEPYIGEAKGRFSNIDFSNAMFGDWRRQFDRITVSDAGGRNFIVKGYIVATRFATEKTSKVSSKVLAEDPQTRGDFQVSDNEIGLGRGCIALHYARLLSKLGLNLLANSLEHGFVVPDDLRFTLPVWRCLLPPLQNFEFVGGIAARELPQLVKLPNERYIYSPNILLLSTDSPVFFGIELGIFAALRKVAMGGWSGLEQLREMPDLDFRPSDLAWLRDGSISGRLDYFELVRFDTF